jgi:3-phenylpropionate/trans-cinnamate dioxygenase ferredoxin subunit
VTEDYEKSRISPVPAYVVPEARGLAPGQKVIVTVQGRELGIFNVDGRLHAVRNVCPDQSGPLCQGEVFGRIDGEVTEDRRIREVLHTARPVIACPWHAWEYDLATGECLWNPKYRVKVYPVEVSSDGTVSVTL